MTQSNFNGLWALVTGASSGMGKDYAELLAAQGANLVLTARRESALESLASDLRKRYGVEVVVRPGDLSQAAFREQLVEELSSAGQAPDILINNAGFGLFGFFAEQPWSQLQTMLDLDIAAITHLTHLVLPAMTRKGRGYILQVASIGGYQPTPAYAAYAAAKSYVLHFGEALNRELKGTGVHVSVLSPGITRTEFLDVAGQKPTLYQRLFMMPSRPVAKRGLKALARNTPSVIPGVLNKLMAQSLRIMPRRLQTSVAYQLMRNH